MILGDHWLRKNEVEEASELYEEAQTLCEQLQNDSNVPSLNQLQFSTDKIPKVIQVLRKNKNQNQYILVLQGEEKSDEKIDLSKNGFLQSIESLITLKKGKLEFLKGNTV